MRVIVVGAGVVGTMHAWHAVERGHEVVQIERETEARGASVRNFGQIWVSGRASGEELETALRARELWETIGGRVPGLGFRANGSLTAVRERTRAGGRRSGRRAVPMPLPAGRSCSPPTRRAPSTPPCAATSPPRCGASAMRPSSRGTAQRALKEALLASGRYTYLGGREVRDVVGEHAVRDDHGDVHTAATPSCSAPGAWLGGLVRELAPGLPVRRVRLQMMQTDPLGRAAHHVRRRRRQLPLLPRVRGRRHCDALNSGQAQAPVAAAHAMQLLMVQRRGRRPDHRRHPRVRPALRLRHCSTIRTSTSPPSSSPSSAGRCRGSAAAGRGCTRSAPTPPGSCTASRCATACGW